MRGSPADGRARLRNAIGSFEWPVAICLAIGLAATVVVAKLFDGIRDDDSVARVDTAVTDWLIGRRTDANMSIMRAVTRSCDTSTVVAVVLVAATVLLATGRKPAAMFVVASSAGTSLLVIVGKLVVGRSRPPVVEAIITAQGYAFPSGHAAQSIACYGGLAIVGWGFTGDRRLRTAVVVGAAAIALAVGLSRIWLGVHWLSDVIAGWTIAIGWLALLVAGRRLVARPLSR